ncbi:NTP transferase domain-containing protein [Candidatus Marinarcus aquaticus]|uniref:Sugar nucleotidyltransferase n=1 Tax=Candidatus Marinarcus aquaticus TaxID=2044504 RepID=A0A4Q0XN06_9BACT|nr:phosphocholine cytidylyltransferase family protein [Candidatus Marinarcus aquaticus]RXJ55376.1 sugar nucleotidyltransferase [Candidatus Marinarcus aquaticus]
MKVIILAAGQGTRLRPLTNNQPKCMVAYNSVPIIRTILNCIKECGIDKTSIVTGYKSNVLKEYLNKEQITYFENIKYDSTNMTYSLFCAKEWMNDDLIISYSDIIYDKQVLKKLMDAPSDISVVVDKSWKQLWLQRMDNPLLDAETLKVEDNKIIELGKKPRDYSEIDGQYIGLIKISKKVLPKIIHFYDEVLRKKLSQNEFDNMYMTTFIQEIIDNLHEVNPVWIDGKWLEVDCVSDLEIKMINKV